MTRESSLSRRFMVNRTEAVLISEEMAYPMGSVKGETAEAETIFRRDP